MRRALLTLGVLLSLVLAAPRLWAQSVVIQRVLVKVNGEIFTQKDLEEKQIDALQATGKGELQGDALTKAVTDLMPDLLVAAVDEMLIVQRGRELGFHLSDDEFKDDIAGIKKDNNLNDAQFKAALEQDNLTLDMLRTRVERTAIIRDVQRREIIGHMNMTEEESHQYYDKHHDEFMKPPTVTLREILVAVKAPDAKPGQPQLFAPPVEDAAKAKIASLRDRALKGEDFEKLVAEASDSPTKATGGIVGPVNVSEMATGIRDLIDKLKPGDVTPPIRTPRGYQLFRLESRSESVLRSFEEVRDDIAQKIGEGRLAVDTAKYVQNLRTQAFIDWKRPDLQQLYEKRVAEKTPAQ